jgi:hypothetical protein
LIHAAHGIGLGGFAGPSQRHADKNETPFYSYFEPRPSPEDKPEAVACANGGASLACRRDAPPPDLRRAVSEGLPLADLLPDRSTGRQAV